MMRNVSILVSGGAFMLACLAPSATVNAENDPIQPGEKSGLQGVPWDEAFVDASPVPRSLDCPEWTAAYPQYAFPIGEGKDGEARHAELNPTGNAPAFGFVFISFLVDGATADLPWTLRMKRPSAAAKSAVKMELYEGGSTSKPVTSTLCELTDNWEDHTLRSAVKDGQYSVALWVNGGGVKQASALVSDCQVAWGGSLPKIRHRVGRQHLIDNIAWRAYADGYQCSSHGHFSVVTEATKIVFEAADFAHYPTVGPVVLVDDKVAFQLSPLPGQMKLKYAPLSLPPGLKTISVITSLQTTAAWGGEPKNFIVRSIFADAPLRWLPPDKARAKRRLVIYGDSIAAGGNADIPGIHAWGPLLRQEYDVAFEASGWKRLLDDRGKLPEVADRIASYKPAIVWLAIGVNDYQGPTPMTTAEYTNTYTRFLDLLHEKLPDALVIAQSPLVKGNEANANAAGHTLADYRTAVKTATRERTWCRYVDGSKILALPDLADGVHPSTAGMAKYAQWAQDFLKQGHNK